MTTGTQEGTTRMAAGIIRRTLIATLLAVAIGSVWTQAAPAQVPAPPGGPVLVVTDPADQFGQYYGEILRAEGLNEFAIANVGTLNAQTLAAYQVVVLAETDLTGAQVSALTAWVNGGGNLIAMRPDASLAGLLGLGSDVGDLANGYLQVQPGRGITGETMQYHDTADLWTGGGGATVAATLFSNASTSTGRPAVTLRTVGAGKAAAFTYDLARSVVYTRQGNPAWAGQERDGTAPIRSDDMFFGAGQSTWVDMNKVAIPQADEQQRLLADLITEMNADRMPVPRFWYLPRGEKAAVIMTGDDHGNGGTSGQFDGFKAESPAGCSVANWECIRSTSYVFPWTTIPNATAYQADGFEIALHLNTGCSDFTPDVAPQRLDRAAARVPDGVPGAERAGDQPHALHRLERLGERGDRGPRERRPARHELLLLARGVRAEPPGHVHRLGLPAALRRHERVADRRLPGGDADDRRVGHRLRGSTSRRCSTGRSSRATTACSPRTCTRTTPTTRAPTRSWRRPSSAASRSSRPSRC